MVLSKVQFMFLVRGQVSHVTPGPRVIAPKLEIWKSRKDEVWHERTLDKKVYV